jgi:hypothetical protein
VVLINGDKVWWKDGFAMKKEKIENGWRYKCNDIQPNDDFTDMVFKIQKIIK